MCHKTPISDVKETSRVYKQWRERGSRAAAARAARAAAARAANGAICGQLLILSFVMASIVYFHPAL